MPANLKSPQTFRRLWFSVGRGPDVGCGFNVGRGFNVGAGSPVRAGPLRGWLVDQGSLTARLLALCNHDLEVQILSQRWGRADLSESRALGLAPRERVMIREVILRGAGRDWVYARSVLPQRALSGRLRCLRNLDNRPLGAWLFRQPGLRRGPLQLSRFAVGDARLQAVAPVLRKSVDMPLMGRRSVFYLDDKALLVGEVFLPDFLERIRVRASGLRQTDRSPGNQE